MLQHAGKAFLRVAAIDRKGNNVPTIFLDIIERKSRQLIGQLRFNFDPFYSTKDTDIRMSFDVLDTSLISPVSGGLQLLESIIIGGILWAMYDNHYTYNFKPSVYMAIHSYTQDEPVMKDINSNIVSILSKIGAKKEQNMWNVSTNDIDFKFVQDTINRY